MKRIVRISLFLTLIFSAIPALVSAFTFPDYEKESKILTQAICDDGNTLLIQYKAETYKTFVVSTTSGHKFYEFSTGQLFYQAADSNKILQLSHEAWDAKLQKYAINFYNRAHGVTLGDCKRIE